MTLEFHQIALKYAALRMRDPLAEARLLASLSEHGQQTPVWVVAVAQAVPFVLIHGYRRVRLLQTLRHDTVEALVLATREVEALLLAHRLERNRTPSALEEAWLLRELTEVHRLSAKAVAEQCLRTPSWVSRRLALVRALPEAVQEAVRSGTLCPHAAMKALVPLARANPGHCERLATALVASGEKLSSRRIETLYGAYRGASADVREEIVDHPLLFLRVDEELARPDAPEPAAPATALLKNVEGLGGLARRTRWELKQLPPSARELGCLELLRAAWVETQADLHALSTRLEALLR
ncbi:MAG: ParB N-terminal domain-containing protein [Deferrisomatales bacterium]|nr:ParB N-terminal domain-containing protein [Deferrisomatales bacterium]